MSKFVGSLLSAFLAPLLLNFSAQAKDEQFLVQPHRSSKGNSAKIVVIKNNRRYIFEDITIRQRTADGSIIKIEPGQTENGWHFDLSPDERWFLVIKSASNHLWFPTLFRRVKSRDSQFKPVKMSSGLRLDEEALRVFARKQHISASDWSLGRWHVNFKARDMRKRVLYFTMFVNKENAPGRPCHSWLTAYHLDSGKIGILKPE